jgi:hypothetical protein
MLAKLRFPKEVCDWATAYPDRVLASELAGIRDESRKLGQKTPETQATLDALLLKAAEAGERLERAS